MIKFRLLTRSGIQISPSRNYRIFDLYKEKFGPQRTHVGTCPIYGHKYYEINPQKHGLFKGSEFKTYKRECDWNFGEGYDFEKMTPHEKYWKVQELTSKTLFVPEWDRWMRMKKRDPPTDEEVYASMAKKQKTAEKGRAIEDRYKEIKGIKSGDESKVHTPFQGEGHTQNEVSKDGVEEAKVDEWRP